MIYFNSDKIKMFMQTFKDIIYFIAIIFSKTFIDLFRLFGNIIIFGFILYVLSSMTRRIFAKTLGAKTELYMAGLELRFMNYRMHYFALYLIIK